MFQTFTKKKGWSEYKTNIKETIDTYSIEKKTLMFEIYWQRSDPGPDLSYNNGYLKILIDDLDSKIFNELSYDIYTNYIN